MAPTAEDLVDVVVNEDGDHDENHGDADADDVNDVIVPWYKPLSRIRQLFCQHMSWSEAAGSVGDLGTFLPLLVALGRFQLIRPGPALFWAGLANVLTGFLWDCPMPVQPMKSIATTALVAAAGTTTTTLNISTNSNSVEPASLWTAATVTMSGVWMGAILCTLAMIPGSVEWLSRLVPRSVVAGMQVGVGLALALHGLEWLIAENQGGNGLTWSWNIQTMDSLSLGIGAWILCLWQLHTNSSSSVATPPPVALYVFGLAVVLALVRLQWGQLPPREPNQDETHSSSSTWSSFWVLSHATHRDVELSFWQGALPQLPLTLLNSVVSVCALADTLFASKQVSTVVREELALHENHTLRDAEATTFEDESLTAEYRDTHEPLSAFSASPTITSTILNPRHVALSVGLLNLLACPWGAMPVCHGAGGLAGQYKCGARHGTSIVLLGLIKMAVALLLSHKDVLLIVLDALPVSLLSVLILIAGHELAVTGIVSMLPTRHGSSLATFAAEADERFRTDAGVCLWTAAVIVGLHKTHYGALTGCVAACLTSRWGQRRHPSFRSVAE